MTREEFQQLPGLVMEHHLEALGYGRSTVVKFVDCGVLVRICPRGGGHARYQKRQVAQLLKWEELLAADAAAFRLEAAVMSVKAVQRWTGWSDTTLSNMARAGGLSFVKPPGSLQGKFLKEEIGRLIGFLGK